MDREEVALSALADGEAGMVVRVSLGGAVGRRLLEMGLTPGIPVWVVRRAPLGDPLQIRLRGYALAMRARDAQRIRVRRCAQRSN